VVCWLYHDDDVRSGQVVTMGILQQSQLGKKEASLNIMENKRCSTEAKRKKKRKEHQRNGNLKRNKLPVSTFFES